VKFMLFICTDSTVAHFREAAGALQAWLAEGEERGIRVEGQRLRPPTDAKLLRVREEELIVSDGPFTESKEWIGGYDILDCKDLAEAIDFASRHPMARSGQIEIRPFWPL
jgi:hypothetical protein